MRIGVIAIQGNVEEHINAIQIAGKNDDKPIEVLRIKHKGIVNGCDAIIIPGGESTTLGKLMEREGISSEIKMAAKKGVPILGTCAGLVLLAKNGDKQVEKTKQPLLGLMDIRVNRNAFGRQKESFEIPLSFKSLDEPYNAVFIRAPCITECGKDVEILAEYKNMIVAARQGNVLALAFHPELTKDLRIHQYFLKMIDKIKIPSIS